MKYIKILGNVSPYCKKNNCCPGYLIFGNNKNKILLDCGPGISSKMKLPDDLKDLKIIISHYHKDHYLDLFSLGYASYCYHKMNMLDKRIEVYVPLVKRGEEGYDDYKLIMNFRQQYLKIIPYDEKTILNFDNINISFFETYHSITNYSVKLSDGKKTIVYSGDMGYSRINKYSDYCKNADMFICESTYLEDDNKSSYHLSAMEAAKIAVAADIKTLVLTHFWPERDYSEYIYEAKKIYDNVIPAIVGQNIKIK